MMISANMINVSSGVRQSDIDIQKSPRPTEETQTRFDDVLNAPKNDQSSASSSDKVYSDDRRHEKAPADNAADKTDKSASSADKKLPPKKQDTTEDKNDEHSNDAAVSTLATILGQLNTSKNSSKGDNQLTLTLDKSKGGLSLEENADLIRAQAIKNAKNAANSKISASNGKMAEGDVKLSDAEGLLGKKMADSVINGNVKNGDTLSAGKDKTLDLSVSRSGLINNTEIQEPASTAKNSVNGASNNNLLNELANASRVKMADENGKTRDKDGKNSIGADSAKASESKISAAISELKEMNNRNGNSSDNVTENTTERNKSNNGRRGVDAASQNVNNSTSQTNPDSAGNKIKVSFDAGNKVGSEPVNSQRLDVLGRIADIEVTQSRSVGDMRVLRIKLNPENLGTVEARLRKTNEGLHIELHAERQETARLLAADHHMLGKALEKSGFNDDGRLTIMVIDRSTQSAQQTHSSNSGQGMSQDNSGQNFNGQRQSNGQQSQGGHNESRQAFTEFPFTGTPLQDDKTWEERIYRNPDHLVV